MHVCMVTVCTTLEVIVDFLQRYRSLDPIMHASSIIHAGHTYAWHACGNKHLDREISRATVKNYLAKRSHAGYSCGKKRVVRKQQHMWARFSGTHRLDEHHSTAVLRVHSVNKPLSRASID